ncbi:MAG: tetratricopeptide repeat protein [Polyangiaceae bacterium]
MGRATISFIVGFSLLLSALATNARAEGEETPADILFRQGKALMDAGKLEEACRVLEESQRIEPAGGTLLNLASCFERRGMYASAERALEAARDLAKQVGRDDAIAFVEDRLAAVRPNVCVLTIALADRALADTTVELDGQPIAATSAVLEARVDPGAHVVLVETRGAPLWRSTVDVTRTTPARLDVPAPEPVGPRVDTAERAPVVESSAPSFLLPTGAAVVAVGGSLIVGGIVAGVFAMNAWSDAERRCPEVDCDDLTGIAEADDAKTFGDTSTGLFVAGGVLAAGGVAMIIAARLLGAPSKPVTSARGLVLTF